MKRVRVLLEVQYFLSNVFLFVRLFVCSFIYFCVSQAQKLGLIPNSVPQTTGGGEKDDLRSKMNVKPRQLLVLNVTDRDNLTGYLEVMRGP